ncbi:tRNA pseudouridine(55) synthase TruB [soil metagenome]
MRSAPQNPASGILLVDKPQGITSHDVVARARKYVGTRKVGHAGTLDPMATGLLVLGANAATRLLTWIVGLDKEYTATIRLGAATNTDDAEGELGAPADAAALAALTDDAIAAGVAALTGLILQRPSSVSAIKVDGKRAYTLAREGQEVVLASRPVIIHAFEILGVHRLPTAAQPQWVDVDVRVECSTGTYIRALARDLGAALGVGGHLTALRRTRIGPFAVADAAALDETLPQRMLAPAAVATELFGRVDLTAEQARELGNGSRIPLPSAGPSTPGPGPVPIAAVAPDGRLVGLIEVVDGRARVLVNFPPDVAAATPPGSPDTVAT